MKTPPLLLAISILFWGWQTGLLFFAVPMAVGIELHRLVKKRWEMNRADWSKVTDFSAILLLSVLAHDLLQDEKQLVYAVGKMLPLILLPLIIAQQFNLSGKTDIAALSLLERKKKTSVDRYPPADISPAYFIAALLAAGIGNDASEFYFPGVFLLAVWALFSIRSRHFSLGLWAALIVLTGSTGYLLHTGLHVLEEMMYEYSSRMLDYDPNPFKTTTAIGDIRKQKLYNFILFRVKPETIPNENLLLCEATYNTFNSRTWYAMNSPAADLKPTAIGNWTLHETDQTPPYSVRIRKRNPKGRVILKLPPGTTEVQQLRTAMLQTNSMGTASFENPQKQLLDYRTVFTAEPSNQSPPNELDLRIPDAEIAAINRFSDQLQLKTKSPEQVVKILEAHFANEFNYSLDHKGKGKQKTPIANFLLERKAGHCELFASSTVLLLRYCGIPARYAVGYVAAEYSPIEKHYLIRQRHAHAWTRVYLNGRWHDLDTTSGNWLEQDAENETFFRRFGDFGSFLSFQFQRLRESDENILGKAAAALIIILIALVANRLRKQKRKKKAVETEKTVELEIIRNGLDSAFYQLEKQIAEKGWPRAPAEPLFDWAARLQQAAPNLLNYESLNRLINLHYALRFSNTPQITAEKLQRIIDELNGQVK